MSRHIPKGRAPQATSRLAFFIHDPRHLGRGFFASAVKPVFRYVLEPASEEDRVVDELPVVSVIYIVNLKDNPDYKIPWIIVVLSLPVFGLMLYFIFYSRKLGRRERKRIVEIEKEGIVYEDGRTLAVLKGQSLAAYGQIRILGELGGAHAYEGTAVSYYPLGEMMFEAMKDDLMRAEKFVFIESFIIEKRIFWNSILDILIQKVAQGVDVRLVYDDIGSLMSLPPNYYRIMEKTGIRCVPFAKLRGGADNSMNNRSHRKIMVIDGKVGFTGGINLADEYINAIRKYGHWKDVGVRLEGSAVGEMTRLFLSDYFMSRKEPCEGMSRFWKDVSFASKPDQGVVVPFGDGPRPIYRHEITRTLLINMFAKPRKE